MSDYDLFNKIIHNFLEVHRELKPIDILKYEFVKTSCFTWDGTKEGYSFWSNIYESKFKGCNENFLNFMKKCFFSTNFIYFDYLL